MSIEHRRDRRHSALVCITLLRGRAALTFTTRDVSYRGLFIEASSSRIPLRELMKAVITLEDGTLLSTHVVAVHTSGGPRGDGVGVAFFGLDGDSRKRWHAFVSRFEASAARGRNFDLSSRAAIGGE